MLGSWGWILLCAGLGTMGAYNGLALSRELATHGGLHAKCGGGEWKLVPQNPAPQLVTTPMTLLPPLAAMGTALGPIGARCHPAVAMMGTAPTLPVGSAIPLALPWAQLHSSCPAAPGDKFSAPRGPLFLPTALMPFSPPASPQLLPESRGHCSPPHLNPPILFPLPPWGRGAGRPAPPAPAAPRSVSAALNQTWLFVSAGGGWGMAFSTPFCPPASSSRPGAMLTSAPPSTGTPVWTGTGPPPSHGGVYGHKNQPIMAGLCFV